ncbi:5' exonuclease Apollo [Hordeum vulgare subsp. vulgare]|uniref:Protein artemis n=1 Tax=Hordeum vulgare subsp. vulgare TaxID=112509 RepID=A0A8I6XAI9_HORVV|nr:5' exonuclease Apollo [Hordeum vulgare subsp. vulgare]
MDEGLVSVDKFSGGSQVYFLTHLHLDHTRGLGASGGWRHGPLYCSPATARLLPIRFPGVDASLLRPVAAGASASLSLSSPNSGRPVSIHVTALPALHCPGSLMFLFRSDIGCMLYTGDFRWELGCDKARSAKKALLDALAGDTVDVLYLDNTYCHPSLNFPPRHVVAQQIVDIIRAHPDHEFILGIDTLGKEDLLLYIARALQTKIWVWPQRLLTIHLLGIDNNEEIFTTQTSLTRIRAVPRYALSIESLEALNTVCPTIGIMPSGSPWLWRNSEGKAKFSDKAPAKSSRCKGRGRGAGAIEMNYDPLSPPKLFEKDSYTLPYSDHACFLELEDFMQTVRPSAVVGIVRTSYCYVNPRGHFGHLCADEDEACTDNTPVKNDRHAGNSTPLKNSRHAGNSTPVKNGRHAGNSTPVKNGRHAGDSTPVKNGRHAGNSTPVKNGRHAGNSPPKRRPSALKTPRRRMVKISSPTLYRSRAIMMKRRHSCGAKIEEPEETIPFS